MDEKITTQGLGRILEKNLTLVECVEMLQLLFEKRLEGLIISAETRGPGDMGLIPIRPLEWSDKGKILGELPYHLALAASGGKFDVDPEIVNENKKSYDFSFGLLKEDRPDLPFAELEELILSMVRGIGECWKVFKEKGEGLEDGQTDSGYSLFLSYIDANAADYITGFPESFRAALCGCFKVWLGDKLKVKSDMEKAQSWAKALVPGTELNVQGDIKAGELTPVEQTEFFHIQVEECLKELNRVVEVTKSGGIALYTNPRFRKRYFPLLQGEAMMWYQQHLKQKDQLRIERLGNMIEGFKSELESLDLEDNIKVILLGLAKTYGGKIGWLFYKTLEYFDGLSQAESSDLSPVWVNYMRGNASDPAEDFRAAACLVYKVMAGD